MPYTPEQNGCSERENRTLVEAARSMMFTRGELPKVLWAELINTAAYILNRTGPTKVDVKVPYELWHGRKPKISHLKIIGSECYAHVPKQNRKKLDKKAIKGMLIGYENDDGYRIWNGSRTIKSRDITFESNVEHKISITPNPSEAEVFIRNKNKSQEIDSGVSISVPDSNIGMDNIEVQTEQNSSLPEDDEFNDAMSNDEDAFESGGDDLDDVENLASDRVLRDRSLLRRPTRFHDFIMTVVAEPTTYKEAVTCSEKELWMKAMESEIESLNENKTWTLQKLPKNRKAIPCKWVFRKKMNADGSVDKYKARLVAKGYRQRKGEDYDQTFSPVAKMSTVRTLLSIAANENLTLCQFDVSTAFLYGSLNDEEIYMKQPEGYDDGSGRVCRLRKSLYGLKQAPRCWNKTIFDFFKELGFVVSEADPCLFKRVKDNKKLIVGLYVDDGLVAASNQEIIDEFLSELKGRFKITVKPASFYLGIEIKTREGEIKIHQTSYIKKTLKRFGMEECRPVSTPIIKDDVPQKTEKADDFTLKNYRQIVGALAYLMVATRPDIAYAVSVVSRSLESPTEADSLKLKRILRYLQYTPDLGIIYKRNYKSGVLECFSDADHGGDISTGRSTTGVLCMYAGGAVTWLSQRQPSVAISTTEAEVVAASEATREIVWLNRLLSFVTKLEEVPVLHVDNEAAIRLAENPEYHRRTKHIRIRHFFVREIVHAGELLVKKISSELQLADFLTKPLPRPRLQRLASNIGLQREKVLK